MKILKKIVSTSCIFLFASVDMWTKRCLSILCFLSGMYSSQFWQKSVDRWTSKENSEKNSYSVMYILIWQIWTCGKKESFDFCFLSVIYLSQFWQKVWTCGQIMRILKKTFDLLFKGVDKWTRCCLSILLFPSTLYPSKFWQKSVDRWTGNEKFWQKFCGGTSGKCYYDKH